MPLRVHWYVSLLGWGAQVPTTPNRVPPTRASPVTAGVGALVKVAAPTVAAVLVAAAAV
ncbi:hypothetical protein QE406_003291 [Microbacterium testaceum]|uniref:hypothetical protein n=1 Tax=Microbacterium testaceum TaxID=2033 RepID=UPI0027851EE0|nr:hypothetical protein [Microbacterium testaceum]MDQ1117282.1 hypothetical protein [Microbacterium testaceum]